MYFKRQTRSSQRTGNQRTGNRKLKTETRDPFRDRIYAKIMMEALTVRGLQDTDTIKPENLKSETEDGNSKTRYQRNLSKDHDGHSDRERTSRHRQDQTREWEIINRRWKLEILFSMESKQRS